MKRGIRMTALVASLAAAGTMACGDLLQEPDTGIATRFSVSVLSGDDQTGAAGSTLPQPLRVRVTSLQAEQVERLWVEWVVLEGGGRVEPRNSFTDDEGIAEARWTLGSASARQRVMARFDGDSALFEATCSGCP